jgi:hypothetical protein
MDYYSRIGLTDKLVDNPEAIKWLGRAESRLWLILARRVIRKPNNNKHQVPNYIYEKFYKKGKLATSWGLKPLSRLIGYGENGASNVSKLIKSLTKKGIIKRHNITINNKKMSVYEVGYISKQENVEITYAYEYFNRKNSEQFLEKNFKNVSA